MMMVCFSFLHGLLMVPPNEFYIQCYTIHATNYDTYHLDWRGNEIYWLAPVAYTYKYNQDNCSSSRMYGEATYLSRTAPSGGNCWGSLA